MFGEIYLRASSVWQNLLASTKLSSSSRQLCVCLFGAFCFVVCTHRRQASSGDNAHFTNFAIVFARSSATTTAKMLISDNRKEFYDVIHNARSRVLVYVSHELDSITAAKILCHIFECDHIQYTIVPIRSRNELHRSYIEHRETFKFVILINLGAFFDVLEFFIPEPEVKFFIADCHRPLNVNNVYYDANVYYMCAISNLNNIENEFEKIPKYDELFWDSDIEDDDDEVDLQSLTLEQLRKRNRFKEFEKHRAEVLETYEETTYYSYSTSLIFFDLAWKLGKDNNELLLFAILSVVDKENQFKLQDDLTKLEIAYLHDSMLRLRNIRTDRGFVLNRNVNNNIGGHNNNNSNDPNQPDEPELLTTTNHLSLFYEKDLNLRLYREWSLLESLRYSMYVACKFKIWKFRGYKKLQTFLADLGIPLAECKQKFTSMDLSIRNTLLTSIEEKMTKYGINAIICESFIATKGMRQKFSTKDLAEATRALLESPDKEKSYNEKFYDAYGSLSWSNSTLMETGISLAKAQLMAIAKQVQLIIDAHLMSQMGNVLLYVIIPEGAPDINFFCHPGCLRALAIYSLYSYAAVNYKSKSSLHLPLVLLTPDPERPTMGMVCGISPLLAIRECRTFFKSAFDVISKRLARTEQNWAFEECSVDPDVVYISWNERMTFLNELSLLLEVNT